VCEVEAESTIVSTSGRALARNTIWNLVGQGTPLLAGLFAIPLLIKGLGTDRFGILTLAWLVVGYFGLFDLGLGRALTKLVAEKLGAGKEKDIPSLVWTALFLMIVLACVGMVVLGLLCPWLVHDVLKTPKTLQSETLYAFYLLTLSIPIVISIAGLRGLLEAYQRFGLINAVRIPMGVFIFLGPLAVLPFSNSLFPIVAVLMAGRVLALGVYLWLCLRLVPELRHAVRIQREMVRPLLSFGSWMTVTNIIGPLMVYIDRFLIGGFVSMAAVAYYATPYEVVTKLWIIPTALVAVLFPAFSATLVQDRPRAARLFGRGINFIFIAIFPLTLIIVTLAHEGLQFWIGKEFADKSTFVLQWLAIGVFVNSLARVPSALIQGSGRPDLAAITHIVELPLYLLALWFLLDVYGIQGVAIAWVVRVGVDTFIFFAFARRLLPETGPVIRCTGLIVSMGLIVLIVSIFIVDLLQVLCFILRAHTVILPVWEKRLKT